MPEILEDVIQSLSKTHVHYLYNYSAVGGENTCEHKVTEQSLTFECSTNGCRDEILNRDVGAVSEGSWVLSIAECLNWNRSNCIALELYVQIAVNNYVFTWLWTVTYTASALRQNTHTHSYYDVSNIADKLHTPYVMRWQSDYLCKLFRISKVHEQDTTSIRNAQSNVMVDILVTRSIIRIHSTITPYAHHRIVLDSKCRVVGS